MVSNKNRLYVALYPSSPSPTGERQYHWAFLIGPKVETAPWVPGTRFHVKNTHAGWSYDERAVANVKNSPNLLGRVLIAKIADEPRLLSVLRDVPLVQNDPAWRCRSWAEAVVEAIKEHGGCVTSSVLDWHVVEKAAREFIGDKADEGRYRDVERAELDKPTFDLLRKKETIP